MKIIQKHSPLGWSTYIEDCCLDIGKDAETLGDTNIPWLVQLQHIIDKMDRLSVQHAAEMTRPDSVVELYTMQFRTELESIRERLPFPLDERRESGSSNIHQTC